MLLALILQIGLTENTSEIIPGDIPATPWDLQ